MIVTRTVGRLMSVLILCLLASACGNANQDASELIKKLPAALASIGKKPQPTGVAPDQIDKALAATRAPVALFTAEARQNQFLMLEIERNGAYRTFGSSSRQSITFLDGMMVATRGLGNDLMSSDAASLYALVSARKNGSVRYTLRFLSAEDKTTVHEFECSVSPAVPVAVQAGQIDTTAQSMIAVCRGEYLSFSNVYAVDRSGRIISARQWMGDKTGYMTVQMLRY